MLAALTRALFLFVLGLASVVLVAWTAAGGPLDLMDDALDRDGGAGGHDGRSPWNAAFDPAEAIGRAVGAAWQVARPVLVGGAIIALALMGARTVARRRRCSTRLWLLPYRADEATPESVEALYKAWHEQLSVRWWRRLVAGQPALTLEVHTVEQQGARRVRLVVGCPARLADGLSGPLHACWPNARLIPGERGGWDFRAVVRLRKRYRFVRRLATPERGFEPPPMDGVLATVGGLEGRAVVQLALTPAPSLFDYLARGMLRSRERGLERARERGGDPGVRAQAADLELQGARATQWKPLWFLDARIAADSQTACRQIAGALQAASAENRLRQRLCLARRGLYLRRMARGLGNPLPGMAKGVVSTSELAGLYQLPSASLRAVGLERSAVPRAIAPPQVLRPTDEAQALGRDEVGYVALHRADLPRNLALIGQIGAGKTSVLARTTARDAADPDACVIVIDPNSTGVAAHLSAVPAERVVHLLDVARPECGFNPLLASGAISKVADDLCEAFIDVHDDGEIMTSSRQFLGGAAEAVIGAWRKGKLDHEPSLWDLYRVLLPNQRPFRERLLDAIASDRELLGAATLLGEDIPQGLRDIGAQYALRLSAPRNKLFQLRSRNIDRVLRHPVQLDLADIIARRQVLIVDGAMGSTGVYQTRVLVMFLLNLVFAEQRAQLERPQGERVRVCLKLDEAHLVMGQHFATALATLRAAGLETTVCYQYSAQLEDRVVRSGAASLLASRCVFQLSEVADAEETAKLCMSAYSSSVRDDPVARARMAVTPDAIMHLPRHFAICSWQALGARVPAFAMSTLPLAENPERIAHHRARQRERGYHVPDTLPHPLAPVEGEEDIDPLADLEGAERRAQREAMADTEPDVIDRLMRANGNPEPRATAVEVKETHTMSTQTIERPRGAETNGHDGRQRAAVHPDADMVGAARVDHRHTGRETTVAPEQRDAARRQPQQRADNGWQRPDRPATQTTTPPQRGSAGPVPETYLEVQIEPSSLIWDDAPVEPLDPPPAPDERDLEILSCLHRLGPLLTSQIQRQFLCDVTDRSVQRTLAAMRKAGWVRRFRLREAHGRGQPKYVYVLARRGFEIAKGRPGPRGAWISADARFVEHRYDSILKPLHDLHANGVLFALLHRMPTTIQGWKGPGEGILRPPRRRPRAGGDPRPIGPADIPLASPLRLSGLRLERFEAVKPDLTLELALPGTKPARRFDLLVELDRTSNPRSDSNLDKLARYDALLCAWHLLVARYRTLGSGPVVLVVCQDEPAARRWASAADELLTGRLSRLGESEAEARFPARRRMFFATELDLHRGLLRGYRAPAQPRAVRRQLGDQHAATTEPELVSILPARYLR